MKDEKNNFFWKKSCQAFLKMSQNNWNISPGFSAGALVFCGLCPHPSLVGKAGKEAVCFFLCQEDIPWVLCQETFTAYPRQLCWLRYSMFSWQQLRSLCRYDFIILPMMFLLFDKFSELLSAPRMIHWRYVSFFRFRWSVVYIHILCIK